MGSAQSAGCTAAVWRLSATSTSWFPAIVLARNIVAGKYLPRLFLQTRFRPPLVSGGRPFHTPYAGCFRERPLHRLWSLGRKSLVEGESGQVGGRLGSYAR